ncbi:MAG: hypothetical protein J6C26_08960 [Clostridia bacterium]|nr:hypothetical protein [Clostridia bacterium]
MDWLIAVGICVVVVGGVIFLLGLVFSRSPQVEEPSEDASRMLEQEPLEDAYAPAQPVEFRATVVDLRASARLMGSSKFPKAVTEYLVFFEKEDGTPLTVEVPQEFFEGFAIGQTGTVTMVSNRLYGFAPDDVL